MTSSRTKQPPKAGRLSGRTPFTDKLGAPVEKDSGRVVFDERGNSIWEWAVSTGTYSKNVSTQRLRRLDNGSLAIADEAPTPTGKTAVNVAGMKKGYDPYESGRLAKAGARGKKDLRKLGEWLNLRKQAKKNKESDE